MGDRARCLGTGTSDFAWAQNRQKQVLTLYASRRDAQIVVVGDREIPRILANGLAEGLDYYSEFIEQGRFSDPDYQLAFRDFLRLKYKEHAFDLIIAMDSRSVEFVDRNRSELFPDTPVVFFIGDTSPLRPVNATGVIAELDLAGTLVLATELQPDIRNVFVVSDAEDNGKLFEDVARGQFRPFESRLAVTYLSGLPTKELEARLATLPEHSIVYYLVVYRDGNNENFHPLDYLERISAIANAPAYCWVDSAMDRGIVGGSLRSQQAEVEAVAKLALRVLHGEQADSIPPSAPDLNVRQVDWRQLRRWGISESRVPGGTQILFQEPSTWDRYKVYIIGTVTLLFAQTLLISGLLVQRRRRRQAEERVRGSQAELRTSYERIRDLGARLLTAQDAERSRIARELHDDISQQVALLEIDLEGLGGAVEGHAGELAGEALNRTQSIARSVHDFSHRLHPAKLRLIGLVASLRGLQRELSQSDIAIAFTHDRVPSTLPADVTLCLFRIVQEALQNAIKYSRAHHVSVHLRGMSESLTLTIVDDGVGFDVDAAMGKGLGLVSMRERLEAIGGALEISSKPGTGTRLEVRVPLTAVQDAERVADSA